MPKKDERCVKNVNAKGKANPYAVCSKLRGKGHKSKSPSKRGK